MLYITIIDPRLVSVETVAYKVQKQMLVDVDKAIAYDSPRMCLNLLITNFSKTKCY